MLKVAACPQCCCIEGPPTQTEVGALGRVLKYIINLEDGATHQVCRERLRYRKGLEFVAILAFSACACKV